MNGAFVLFSKRKLVYSDGTVMIFYHHGSFFVIKNGRLLKKTAAFVNPLFRLESHFRLLERALRLEPRQVYKDNDSYFFALKGSIFSFSLTTRVHSIYHFADGTNAPLHFSFISQRVGSFSDCYLFGSYFENSTNRPVFLYSLKNGVVTRFTQFPLGSVKHVHNIVPDYANQRIFVLTGDDDAQSGFFLLNLDDNSLQPYLIGKQQYRSCFCYILKSSLFWASDSPLRPNFVYSFSGKDLDVCGPINGPAINSCCIDRNGQIEVFFVSTVEPDPRGSSLRYLLSRRRSDVIRDDNVHLYRFDGSDILDILQLPKDPFPMGLMQLGNGNLIFDGKQLFFMPIATRKFDGCTLSFSE